MLRTHRIAAAAAFALVCAASARGQSIVDPSGHWQGELQAPGMSVAFEVDFAKRTGGGYAGAVSIPSERLKGLPLTKVTVDGKSIAFEARADQPLTGVLSDDGKSITGDFLMMGASVPFVLTRSGEAQLAAPPKSAPISRALEGEWDATLDANGQSLRLVLTLANEADGSATGRVVNVDEGGLQIPLAVTQNGANVTLDFSVLAGASFAGTLDAAGTQLADQAPKVGDDPVHMRGHARQLPLKAEVLGPLDRHREAQRHCVQRLYDPIVDISTQPPPFLHEHSPFLVSPPAKPLNSQRDLTGEHGHGVHVVSLQRRPIRGTGGRQDANGPSEGLEWDHQRRPRHRPLHRCPPGM